MTSFRVISLIAILCFPALCFDNPVLTFSNSSVGSSIEKFNAVYYLLLSGGQSFDILTSKDLRSWSDPITVISPSDIPDWMISYQDMGFFNVDLYISESGQFNIYFGTLVGCIGVATADVYSGPYTISDPLLCQRGYRNFIYNSPVIFHENGESIMYHYQSVHGEESIVARKLSKDGLSVSSEETSILKFEKEGDPHNWISSRVLKNGDMYYVIYGIECGNYYIARSSSPVGQFEVQESPFVTSNNTYYLTNSS